MHFLAIVRYSHGKRLTHEFRCPLERRNFVTALKRDDPQAKVKFRTSIDEVDRGTVDDWYEPSPN